MSGSPTVVIVVVRTVVSSRCETAALGLGPVGEYGIRRITDHRTSRVRARLRQLVSVSGDGVVRPVCGFGDGQGAFGQRAGGGEITEIPHDPGEGVQGGAHGGVLGPVRGFGGGQGAFGSRALHRRRRRRAAGPMRLHAASQFEIDPPVYSDPLANAVQCARSARAVRVSGCVDPETSSMVGSSAVYWSRAAAGSPASPGDVREIRPGGEGVGVPGSRDPLDGGEQCRVLVAGRARVTRLPGEDLQGFDRLDTFV